MNDDLREMLQYLRLRGLLANWDRYLDQARKGKYSHVRLLKYVLEEEVKIKKENARKMRMCRAKIPECLVLETYPFERQPKLNRNNIYGIYDSLDYVTKPRNIIWMGPTGTGKTGLATSFLIHAINQGYKGRFIPFPDLVEQLYQSVADHTEGKVLKTF